MASELRTYDTSPELGLALVCNGAWSALDADPRIVPLSEAPPIENETIASCYLRQLHYVAAHEVRGVVIMDRLIPKGRWTRLGHS